MSIEAPSTPTAALPPVPPESEAGAGAERPPLPQTVFVALASVLALSAIAVFVLIYAVGFSALQEQRSQHQLYASFRGLLSPSSEVAPPLGGAIAPGSPVALLDSPQAGLHNTMIVEGTSSGDLLEGPGHLRDTPLPGQAGETLLMGKSVTAGAPFRHITSLRAGDIITVTDGLGTFHYVVSGVRAAGDPLPTLPSSGSILTLATSTGSGFFGHLAPSHVVYVDANLQGKTVPTPAGRPIAVPVAELAGHSDPGAWPYLVLWLQGLILSGGASVWAWVRWGRWQTWLVGTPIIIGVLWGLSETAMHLVPNLL